MSADAERGRVRVVAAVIVHMAGIGLALGITYPLIAVTFERWQAPAWVTGLAGSLPFVAMLLAGPFLPGWIRRVGAWPAMLGGCALAIGALLALPLAPSVPAWLAARFVMGIGTALPWLVGETWLNAATTERRRGLVVGLYAATFFGGFALGPLALERTGIDGYAPVVVAVGAIVLTLLPLALVSRLAPSIRPADGAPRGLRALAAAPLAGAAALAAGLLESAAFALTPVWGLRMGADEARSLELLAILVAGGLVLQLPLGALGDRMRREALVLTVAALALAATALLLAAGARAATVAWIAWPAWLALGGAALGVYTAGLALLGARVGTAQLAGASAAYLMLYQTGGAVGPTLAGAAVAAFGPQAFPALAAVVAIALGAGAWRTLRASTAPGIAPR